MSGRRLPFRASINTTYAVFFKDPARFTAAALPVPVGFVLWLVIASAMVDAMVEVGRNRSVLGVALFALQYANFILCMGAVIHGADQILRVGKMCVTEAFHAAFGRLLEMVATSIPIMIAGLLFLKSTIAFSSPAWMAAGACLVVLDLTVLALSMPICLLERRGPLASIGRSLQVTKGSRLRFLAAACVALWPIGLATWLFRLAGNPWVNGLLNTFVAAWDIVGLSILSVVALQILSSPEVMPAGGSNETPTARSERTALENPS